ncbi:hypothetical protein OH807_29350 [Kitasatospora sp. NBC_01560]|uniref:hypothetical protein n=1 Tax=Kitasatospora sp. NBC_01560 TaxID=2975965 RepID=UPI003865C0FF
MVSYVKTDPTCTSEILFIGPTGLRPYRGDNPQNIPLELYIDVLAPDEGFSTVDFEDIKLMLTVTDPAGVQFVAHEASGGAVWGVPNGADWLESLPPVPTSRVRLRHKTGRLASPKRPLDGLSHYVGIQGLPDGAGLTFTASATATRVVAAAVGCELRIQDLHSGEQLTGYLGG